MSISNDEGISKLLDLADDKFNENLDSQLKYWKQQLVASPPLLELPTDRPRPTVQSFRGAHQSFTLSLELTKALSLLSRREGVTLFMALLAAFDTLLYRYTGIEDILVGSPIANRNHGEIEELIGFFVNTLVLRTDMSGNPSFQELLGRVREVALQADTHQDLPFQILVEELQPKRDLSYSPLFQVMFAFEEDVSLQRLELFGLTANSRVIENNTAKFDLTLFLEQTSAGLVGKWAYNTDLFDASTIERMTRHFQTILEGIVANPKQLISELPLLTADERQQLLCEWNHTQTDYSQDKCIHQLFEEQVERTPDAVALVFEEQQLTYRELNRRANQLAHYLKTLGVGPEVLVGICVERSLEMVVGMLGIIKAGGAYVPLEPRLPQERLSFMLLDSQVTVLLTQQQLVEGLHQPGTVVVCLDTDWEKIAQENDLNLESQATPENLIYVIFTSGSTGKAKGVEIEHQQLLNYLHGIQERLSLSGGGNFAIASTFAADLGNTVIFPSLCSGGCLHIISIERASDPNAFLDYCQQYPIDCLKIVPSHLSALLSSSQPETILPRQRLILGGEATSWDLIEKIQHSPTQQQTEVQRRLQHSRQRPFNLSEDLMLRGSLLQIGPQEHILLLVMHHIASDGWSRGILLQQLNSLYKAFCHGQPNPLPKMPIQYADFAVWQRQWLQGVGADPCSPLQTQLDYWKQQLAGANPVLELPTDYPRPPVQTYSGASQSIVLNQSLTTALKVLSRQEQVTLFMTLLAAFQTLLYRYSGQEDIIVGSAIAGRNRTELEGLIGFFINTLVLRTHLGGNLSFRELLDRVCQMTLSAHSNQDMPFEKLVEELQLKRDLSRNPLFQVWFNMLNLEEIQLELPGLTVEPILMPEVASKFDLSLYVKEQNQEIKLELVYNPDLFARERMVEMLDQFHHLLLQIVANPETSIAELSLVTPTAKLLLPNPIQQLRSQWVGAVHTSFSQQAQKEPQQLAVVDANVAWTYAELEERTNLLANYLVANHIQPQDIVAIYGHRSATLVWAILGVLKAGAAFVILDPAYPTSRLIDYLHLAQPRASLQITAAGELPVALSEYLNLSCRCHLKLTQDSMVAIRRLFQDYATHDPGIAVGPDHLAYVAFTSGSTGKPKGILGVHKPLSHFLQWHCQTFGLDQSDRFSMLSGLSHDPLLRDIFTPLSLGATLCIPTQNDIATPGKLADWMEQQRVSVAHLTPAMTQLLTATTVTTKYLRYLFFGGDILKVEDLRRIRDFAPTAQSVNFYGATETPQAMGYFRISNQGSSILPNGNVPLGRGIEDVQLLLLNAKQQLAGIGEVGEIYVRTPYLTKGYIGSDELTQERFIINPLTKIPDDRLYKTGDLGRYLPDSNIEFLGRIDHQVKIRGFRIELGEIEAMLSQHPAVQKTVVIVREDVPGDKRLVAYLVPRQEQAPTSELRHFLKQHLPDYMVPSAFVMLAAFPLTPNGKIDRSALPAPEHQRQESEETFVAPKDELELQLKEIWEKVLGVQPIGIRDNFFTLGGHSLIAVRVFTEIEQIWGRNLPLITLFQTQTVEALADILRQSGCIAPWSSLVLIQPGQSKPPLFCIHPIGGNVLEYYGLAHYLGREQPVYGLQAQGLDGKQVPLSRVEDMANHYIKEIRTVQPNGPYFLAGYSFGGVVAFEMAQQLYAQGQKVALLALLDVKSPNLLHIRPSFAESVRIHLSNLWQLELQERLKYIRDRIEYRVGKVNYKDFLIRELSKTGILTNQYLKVLDSNLQASKDYITPVYPGVVTLFRCQVQLLEFALHPELGWGELVAGDLEIHHIPGDHFGLLKEPRVRVLAEKLKLCLERLQTDP